jgi:hypothetical protein
MAVNLSTSKVVGTKSPTLLLAPLGFREADGTRRGVLDVVAEVDEDRAPCGTGVEAATQIHRPLTFLLLGPRRLALFILAPRRLALPRFFRTRCV